MEVSCWALGCLGFSLHTLSLPDSSQSRALNITNALKHATCASSESPHPWDGAPSTPHASRARTSLPAPAVTSGASVPNPHCPLASVPVTRGFFPGRPQLSQRLPPQQTCLLQGQPDRGSLGLSPFPSASAPRDPFRIPQHAKLSLGQDRPSACSSFSYRWPVSLLSIPQVLVSWHLLRRPSPTTSRKHAPCYLLHSFIF